MKTLIIEDDPLQCLWYESQLHALGYDCTCCSDATAALRACHQIFFPLIITDLGLPDMDGLELCHRIREMPQGEKSIILVISGRGTPKDIRAAMEAGADEYLIKPVSPERFTERVMELIRRRIS